MICNKHSKNVEYQQIKANNLFGLDQKSQLYMNNYSIFHLFMLNIAKSMSKWVKSVPKYPLFDIIWHYLNLKRYLFCMRKRIGWLVSTWFGYQILKLILNILNNFSQSNNLPKLTMKEGSFISVVYVFS